jgi:hypothetical protein
MIFLLPLRHHRADRETDRRSGDPQVHASGVIAGENSRGDRSEQGDAATRMK